MKAKALVFDTNYFAEMKSAKLEEGFLRLKDMQIPVDQTRHFTLKRKIFGIIPISTPLFLLKWNSIYPAEFDVVESREATFVDESGREINLYRKELVPINELQFKERQKIYPEMVKDVAEIRFLKRMKSYLEPKAAGGLPMLPLMLALVLGAIIMYMLIASKIIPV